MKELLSSGVQSITVCAARGSDRSQTGWTMLHAAAHDGYSDVALWIVRLLAGTDNLDYMIELREPKYGRTALHLACAGNSRQARVALVLLSYGANVNAHESISHRRLTPLDLAAAKNNSPTVALLCTADADHTCGADDSAGIVQCREDAPHPLEFVEAQMFFNKSLLGGVAKI